MGRPSGRRIGGHGDREEVRRIRSHTLHHVHGHAADHRGDHVGDGVIEVALHSADTDDEAVAVDAPGMSGVTLAVDEGREHLGHVPVQLGPPRQVRLRLRVLVVGPQPVVRVAQGVLRDEGRIPGALIGAPWLRAIQHEDLQVGLVRDACLRHRQDGREDHLDCPIGQLLGQDCGSHGLGWSFRDRD